MRIAFTGTQDGMTDRQKGTFLDTLRRLTPVYGEIEVFRHGDCVGADTDAHRITLALNLAPIVIHPGLSKKNPSDNSKRAFNRGALHVCTPEPFLDRNQTMVNMSEILIATPATAEEQQFGGTWYTIRYARKINRPCVIINPDGQFYTESLQRGSVIASALQG